MREVRRMRGGEGRRKCGSHLQRERIHLVWNHAWDDCNWKGPESCCEGPCLRFGCRMTSHFSLLLDDPRSFIGGLVAFFIR